MTSAAFDAYMICTTPRSGSTLLCGLLAATGCAGRPDSHFHEPSLARWQENFGLSSAAGDSRQRALHDVFDAARARGTGRTGVFGLRMQWGSFAYFREQLRQLYPAAPSDVDRIRATFGRTLFIHLSRSDKLAQAISRVKAQQTGLWHRAPDGTELERIGPPAPAVYDRAAIARNMAELTAWDQAWTAWFASESLRPLRLGHDDLARDPVAVLAEVLFALGVDATQATGVSPHTAKLADETSRSWARRFRAETGGQGGA